MFSELKKGAALAALAIGFGAPAAQAAYENLAQDNSTLALAQYVGDSAAGSINVFGFRGEVFGGLIADDSNADFYSFDAAAHQIISLSVLTPEGPNLINDPVVGLFRSDGTQLAFNDDVAPGKNWDSYLTFTTTAAGRYVAAVSGFADFSFSGGGNTNFPYTLVINAVAAPVPVPAAAVLLGSGLLGLAGAKRRRS